jgi:hypothetical protein
MAIAPSLGWTLLSRDAIKRAEAQLQPEAEGVRDEIGFLAVHQAYADRLFPGTSVLHTRLRYVLFVPWMFGRLASQATREPLARRLQEEERKLAGRLKASTEDGVIGGRVYPKASAQPPSMVYWSALAAWGLTIPRRDGSSPSRTEVLRTLSATPRTNARVVDADSRQLEERTHVFVTVPDSPREWDVPESALGFALKPEERRFLRTRMSAIVRRDASGALALLARLADSRVDLRGASDPWSRWVREVADKEDRSVLVRARQAASLAAVGRAVYAALVEDCRDRIDGLQTPELHRAHLRDVIRMHSPDALALDLTAVCGDEPGIASDPILEVLKDTQHWLSAGRPVTRLADVYTYAEQRRKGVRRARLGVHLVNRERRLEWQPAEHPLAKPLHYRWPQVKRLLDDLRGAA